MLEARLLECVVIEVEAGTRMESGTRLVFGRKTRLCRVDVD